MGVDVQKLNIGNKLIKAVSRQAEKAGYFCSAGNMPANQKVHELRRAFKRLRALLRFFYTIPDSLAWQLATDIRSFGKLLAPLRESAVNFDLFERDIATNMLLPEKKIRSVKEQLADRNKWLIERGFHKNNLDNTIRTFFEGFDKILTLNTAEVPSRLQIFHETITTYDVSYNLYRMLPEEPHPEEWHELRKKLKRLWYQLDFIRFLHPRYLKLKTDQLNKITDQLGDDHDLHVFIEDLMATGYGFEEEALHIIKNQVENLREMNLLKLHPRLKQFFTAPPGEFNQKMERFFRLDVRH